MAEPKRFEGADLLRAFTLSARSFLDYAGLFTVSPITATCPLTTLVDRERVQVECLAYREAAGALVGWHSLGFDIAAWYGSGSMPLRSAMPGVFAFWPNFHSVLARWGFPLEVIEGRVPPSLEVPEVGDIAHPLDVIQPEMVGMTYGWEIMNKAARAEGGSAGPMWLIMNRDGLFQSMPATAEVRVEFAEDGDGATVFVGDADGVPATAEQGHFIRELASAGGRPVPFSAMKEGCPALAYITNQSRFVASLPSALRPLVESVTGYRLAVENL